MSPEHAVASTSSEVEQAEEALELNGARGTLRRVIDTIHQKCNLPVLTPEVVSSNLSRLERLFHQEPQGSLSCNLPISAMAEATLRWGKKGLLAQASTPWR